MLGRAAAMVLGERPDVLNVRLGGRRERRLEAAVARYGEPVEELRREMEANDRAREAYVRHFYRADASSPKHYHLVVDSTALSLDTVVELVVVAAAQPGASARSEAQHRRTPEVGDLRGSSALFSCRARPVRRARPCPRGCTRCRR